MFHHMEALLTAKLWAKHVTISSSRGSRTDQSTWSPIIIVSYHVLGPEKHGGCVRFMDFGELHDYESRLVPNRPITM